MSRRSGSRRQSGGRRLAKGAAIGLLAALGGALPSIASEGEDRAAILILRTAEEGPAADLIAYDALIGGEEVVPASDFGFFQPVDDGYAFAGIRVRVGEALEVTECSGGLAPARVEGLFEGAYACGEELPVPLAYQPALGRMQPNLVDPNGVWVEEGFFVGSEMSVKLLPARGVSLAPGSVGRLTARDAPAEALNGLIGRVSPDGVQASGACGDGVAIFFPRIALAGCADAGLIEEQGKSFMELKRGSSAHSAYNLRPALKEGEERRTLSVLVDNESGVLARVIGLFSGRGYNIESLTVAETDHTGHRSRITVVTTGTPMVIEQIKHQLERMVPIHRVRDLTVEGPSVERELALVKVKNTGEMRVEALRLKDAFRAQVIDATLESFIFEITGSPDKIDAFCDLMRPLGLVDVSRTGVAAISRGPEGM